MKIKGLHLIILNKNEKKTRIPRENHESHDNLKISLENHNNNENYKVSRQNQGNHEHPRIP